MVSQEAAPEHITCLKQDYMCSGTLYSQQRNALRARQAIKPRQAGADYGKWVMSGKYPVRCLANLGRITHHVHTQFFHHVHFGIRRV